MEVHSQPQEPNATLFSLPSCFLVELSCMFIGFLPFLFFDLQNAFQKMILCANICIALQTLIYRFLSDWPTTISPFWSFLSKSRATGHLWDKVIFASFWFVHHLCILMQKSSKTTRNGLIFVGAPWKHVWHGQNWLGVWKATQWTFLRLRLALSWET